MNPITFWLPTCIALFTLGWNYYVGKKMLSKQVSADALKLIHRCQFEKEFEIHTQLWEALVKLRDITAQLRPAFEFVDSSKSQEEWREMKLKAFNEAFNSLVQVFEPNRPFYPIEIYREIEEILKTARSEQIDYTHLSDKRDREYWRKGEENVKSLLERVDRVELLIRNRITVVSVL